MACYLGISILLREADNEQRLKSMMWVTKVRQKEICKYLSGLWGWGPDVAGVGVRGHSPCWRSVETWVSRTWLRSAGGRKNRAQSSEVGKSMAPSLEGEGARSTGLEPPGRSEGGTLREVRSGQILQGLVTRLRSLERILRAAGSHQRDGARSLLSFGSFQL